MIFTQVTWAVAREDFMFENECRAKATEMGITTTGTPIELAPKFIVQRGWTEEADANKWMAFVLELGAESAIIVAESTPTTP